MSARTKLLVLWADDSIALELNFATQEIFRSIWGRTKAKWCKFARGLNNSTQRHSLREVVKYILGCRPLAWTETNSFFVHIVILSSMRLASTIAFLDENDGTVIQSLFCAQKSSSMYQYDQLFWKELRSRWMTWSSCGYLCEREQDK